MTDAKLSNEPCPRCGGSGETEGYGRNMVPCGLCANTGKQIIFTTDAIEREAAVRLLRNHANALSIEAVDAYRLTTEEHGVVNSAIGLLRSLENQLAALPALPAVPALASEGVRKAASEIQQRFLPTNLPSPSAGRHQRKLIEEIISRNLVAPAAEAMKAACVEKVRGLPDHAEWCALNYDKPRCSCDFRSLVVEALQQVEVKK